MVASLRTSVILRLVWSEQLPESFTISIVDDDVSVREAVGSLMRSYGYQARTFESGASFLVSDKRRSTDCLIADIQMPEMSGLELHRILALSDDHIPTILITARHDEEIRRQALASGVLCYLTKPFDEAHLLECVRSAIGQVGGASQ